MLCPVGGPAAYGWAMAVRRLVVKITCGPEALERLNQALNVSCLAVTAGARVSVWLAGDAVWLAVPGRAEEWLLPHAVPLAELRDALLEDAQVTVCSQCAARRELTEADLLPGATIRGSASYVEEILEDAVQALVY